MKDAFSGLVNQRGTAEKRSSELEDKSIEISQKENSKGKKQMGKKAEIEHPKMVGQHQKG